MELFSRTLLRCSSTVIVFTGAECLCVVVVVVVVTGWGARFETVTLGSAHPAININVIPNRMINTFIAISFSLEKRFEYTILCRT
jgi:hypothetical protein